MRYLVCSDIHGSVDAFRLLTKIAMKAGCDRVLSAGDFCPTAEMEYLADSYFLTVSGNCDRWHGFSIMADPKPFVRFRLGNREVVMAHGDRSVVEDYGLSSGDIFISGHTHVPRLARNKKGIYLINPGSPSRPRSSEGPTYVLLEEEWAALYSFPDGTLLAQLDFET